MSDIFISHASADRAHAQRTIEWLQSRGYHSIFLDYEPDSGIAAGSKWLDAIQREVSSATALIFLCSPSSTKSQWCFAELAYATMLGTRVFPVKVEQCDPSDLLMPHQWVDLTIGADDAELRKLERGLSESGLDPHDDFALAPDRPVYRGLYAFDEADAALYFGRSQDITVVSEALGRMQQQAEKSLAIVVGSSGCGKSSLVRAGIVPRLKEKRDRWIVVPPFRPEEAPFARLASALAAAFGKFDHSIEEDEIAARIEDLTGKALVAYGNDLRRLAKQDGARVLLVIDPLEDLFASQPTERATKFLQVLTRALTADGSPLLAVATMRSDLLALFEKHPITATFAFERLPLDEIPTEHLTEVIARPAARTGLVFEDGLVERMVADTQTGEALPLLAFTLGRMFERKERNRFTHGLYREIGGIKQAVGDTAHQVLDGSMLGDDELRALRSAFVQMVRLVEGRRTKVPSVPWDELPAAAHPTLQRFVEARLLMSRADDPKQGRTIEVVHEVLFTAWSDLATWLKEENAYLLWREHFAVSLQGGDGLLSGSNLNDARLWLKRHPDRFDSEACSFIERSNAAERRQAWRMRTLWAAMVIVPLVGLAAWAWKIRQDERLLFQQVTARSNAFVAAALSQMASDPKLSLQLALQARTIMLQARTTMQTPQIDDTLRQAMVSSHVRRVLQGHTQRIESAVFAGGRGAIVTTGSDGVRLWDANGKTRVLDIGPTNRAAVSSDGRLVATAGADNVARLWNAETGEHVRSFTNRDDPSEKHHQVFDVAFSPDGTHIATGQGDGAFIFDVATGAVVASMQGHSDWVTRVAFDPTGRRIVTASNDGSARIWDARTGMPIGATMRHSEKMQIGTMTKEADKVFSASFSPDGRRIVTASEDKTARLWSATTGAQLVSLVGHGDAVWSAAFHPSGRLVVTASNDGTARVWDVIDGREITTLRGHAGGVRNAVFSPDGGFIATAGDDRTARIWETDGWHEMARLRGHTEPVSDVAFSADGLMLLTASADTSARVWQIESDTGIRDLPPHRQGVRSATFSKDGRQVLTAGEDSRAWIWDVDRSRIVATFGSDERPVTCAIFSPNDQMVVTVTANAGLAAVWSAGDGGFIAGLPHDTPLYAAAFMPDGRFLATAGHDGSMTIWDTRTWTKVGSFGRHTGDMYDVAFNPNGTLVASAGEDGVVQVSTTTGTWASKPHALTGHTGPVKSVAFDSSGKQLVTASDDRTAIVWDVEKGTPRLHLRGHTAPVQHAVFSPDDQYIATASRDLTARIWDARTGAQVATLFGHAGPVYDVAFSRDQRFIVTASGDRTVKMYRWETFAPVDELANSAGTHLPNPLGDKELAAYIEPPVEPLQASHQAEGGPLRPVPMAKGE